MSETTTCVVCGQKAGLGYTTSTREGEVCFACSHRVYTCSRCRERTIHAEVFSREGTPEVICSECLEKLHTGEHVPSPYWMRR